MFKTRLLNILFWSVISAAFIGPGTIATAAKAGSSFDMQLLWSLVFSIITCLTLQEASARISIVSEYNLGEAIARQFRDKTSRVPVLILVIGAIIIGSAAYETGNLLGAVGGITLILDIPPAYMVVFIGILAALFLSIPTIRFVARFLGFLVVFMGIAFLTTAIIIKPSVSALLTGAFIPSIPDGSGLLILALIGTTVVPYNLFLGSGITDKAQKVKEMRIGLSIAIILGGIISMAVLIVGSAVQSDFSFETLAQALTGQLGEWALYLFGFGLFAAGFSSAVTAPLASAITARNLFSLRNPEKWKPKSRSFILVWSFVLVTGVAFGSAGFKPIPAIIIAQALNGLILPFISIFLLFVVNDPRLMGDKRINRWPANLLMGVIVWITIVLGAMNLLKALNNFLQSSFLENSSMLIVLLIGTFILTWIIIGYVYKMRKQKT
ncbi:MAG: Nramp family divalent metal transporter [Bacteroidales bacterium]